MTHRTAPTRTTLRPPIGKWGGSAAGLLLFVIGLYSVVHDAKVLGVLFVVVACVMMFSALRTRITFDAGILTVYPLIGMKRRVSLVGASADIEEITGLRKALLHRKYDVGLMAKTGFIGWTFANTSMGAEYAADIISDFLSKLPGAANDLEQ